MDCIEGATRREGAPQVKSEVIPSHLESISGPNGNKRKGGIMQKANLVQEFLILYNQILSSDEKEEAVKK